MSAPKVTPLVVGASGYIAGVCRQLRIAELVNRLVTWDDTQWKRKRQTEHTFTRHAPFCSCDGMCRLSQVSLRPASAESGRRQARTRTTASANPGRPVHPGQGWASAQADT